jgi:hypothetical protein
MPIAKELRSLYPPPKEWQTLRRQIHARAGGRCEQCGLADRVRIHRRWHDGSQWTPAVGLGLERPPGYRPAVLVILTTAHLNHQPGDNRPENLKLLCCRCHLLHDQSYHLWRRQQNRDRKNGQLRIFEETWGPESKEGDNGT